MAINITLSQDAYERLADLKHGRGDSFSKVVLRHFVPPADTAGQLLERFEQLPAPKVDWKRLETLGEQRGRRRAAK